MTLEIVKVSEQAKEGDEGEFSPWDWTMPCSHAVMEISQLL